MKQSLNRIYAVILRHLRPTFRDPMRYLDMFYWPLLDTFLFGFTSAGLLKNQSDASQMMLMVLTGLVMWQIVFRSNLEVTRNLLEEIWHQNVMNLFATPLKLFEWAIAVMILGVMQNIWTVIFGFSIVSLLYGLNILAVGWLIVPFGLSLLCTGWFVGFTSSAIILLLGRRVEMLAWSVGWLLAPFSAVFYAVDVLPMWAQKIAWLLPTTYIFEGMRSYVVTGKTPLWELGMSFGLNAFYASLAFVVFAAMFEVSRNRGLARLD